MENFDPTGLVLETESDVEQKFIMPLLNREALLGIPEAAIHTKEYLEPTILDKAANKKGGYFPDYSIWFNGLPLLIVEAKAPGVPVEEGYREASLYARHLNQAYPHEVNPCRFLIATNGQELLFGPWDSAPEFKVDIPELKIGSAAVGMLRAMTGIEAIQQHALACLQKLQTRQSIRPYNLAGGQALLTAKRPLNTFAADLSPILRRYFSSANQDNNREIAVRAYVSSAEVTEYDRVLEALLKDRLNVRRDTIVQHLEPTRRGEAHVAKAIETFAEERPERGQIQIIQGSVGTGKSLFIRRYKEALQDRERAASTRWAIIDFNSGPTELRNAEDWVCRRFIESFQIENPDFDISSNDALRGIFSRNLQKRRGIYDELTKASEVAASVAKASDFAKWQDDVKEYSKGIADYVLGGKREILVVVMDNVDRLDLKNQLEAFQLALWFMERTRSFVILQMRDETYERFKNKPPLDTFRSGITFHISPPRFVDVVKRRLELSLEYLAEHAADTQTYTLESGMRVSFPKSELGNFLRSLYVELFERRKNVSRVLEAMVGRDIRRALEMFVSIITSGHLSENAITSHVIGEGGFPITETLVLKILMRTDYRFYSQQSGFVTNIFDYETTWKRPNNFILVECLFFLARNRKKIGELGIEGYFSCNHVADELQKQGYPIADTLAALNYLLKRQLIAADHMNFTSVGMEDCVRILASGFIHLRVLSERVEYVYGVLPVTPIANPQTARKIADQIGRENTRGFTNIHERIRAVEEFFRYLLFEKQAYKDRTPFVDEAQTGATYVLQQIANGINHAKHVSGSSSSAGENLLDL